MYKRKHTNGCRIRIRTRHNTKMLLSIKSLAGYLPTIELKHDATVADLADAVISSDPEAYSNCRPVFIRERADCGLEELMGESRRLSSFGLQCGAEEELMLVVKDLTDFNQRLNDILSTKQVINVDDVPVLNLQRDFRYVSSCTVKRGFMLWNCNEENRSKIMFLKQVLSSLKALTYLNMFDLQTDFNSTWIPTLYSMSSLTHLNFNRCILGDHKACELAKPLATLTSLTRLELNFNEIGDVGGRALYPAIARLKSLSYLDLGYNRLCLNPTDKKATYRELSNALSMLPALTYLNLNKSYTSSETWELLAPVFSTLNSLTSLDLSYQHIGQIGFRFLTKALQKTKSLTKLIARSVHVEVRFERDPQDFCEKTAKRMKYADPVYHSFVPMLALELGWLTHLVIPTNRFGDNHIENFAPELPKFTQLQQLNLGENNISDVGCEALASALSKLTTLTELNLCENRIGDDGARALASVLSKLINLTDLNVSYNQIGEDGCRALAPALANLTNLKIFSGVLNKESSCGTGCYELVPMLLSLKSQSLSSWKIGHDQFKQNCTCRQFQLELDNQSNF